MVWEVLPWRRSEGRSTGYMCERGYPRERMRGQLPGRWSGRCYPTLPGRSFRRCYPALPGRFHQRCYPALQGRTARPYRFRRPGRRPTASGTPESENSGESDPETHILRPVRAIPENRVLATLKTKVSRVGPAGLGR